jgi:flagellar motor switch protein FliM
MAGSDLLTQAEIDALLRGVDGGDVDTIAEAGGGGSGILGYDFASQDRIVRGRLPTLEMINERFGRNFRSSLFNLLRRAPSISVESVRMTKFGEYVHSLYMPSNMNMIKVKPLRGTALIVLNPKIVYSLVDCYFGGSGRFYTKIEGREFTPTEMRVVNKVLGMIFDDLREAWAPIFRLTFEHIGSEINPQFANIVTPSEVVVVSSFHIDLECGEGDLHITLPYSMIEPIREILDAGVQSDVTERDQRWLNSMREEMFTAPVTLKSTLTRIKINLGELNALRVGDVLPIKMPETVLARVQGVPVFRGKFGISGEKTALKVVEVIRAADPYHRGVQLEDLDLEDEDDSSGDALIEDD